MTDSNVPAQIIDALVGIPKALVPSCIKAIDRLVGAAIDIPVAWLGQHKAKIEAQTNAFTLVEVSIANAASALAGTDPETVKRAANVLIRKEYRKQENRESVARAMLQDFSSGEQPNDSADLQGSDIDDDWLNVFERYAEDASTERMQNLWGRVLAGEVRTPGRYSMRTLRFLSEFSQADALTFEEFSKSAFGDAAPEALIKPEEQKSIRHLIDLESSGLIQGASGLGLTKTHTLNAGGDSFLIEGSVAVLLKGEPNSKISYRVCAVTPLGQELLSLLPSRDAKQSARTFAHAIRTPAIKGAYIGTALANGVFQPIEILWQDVAVVVEQ